MERGGYNITLGTHMNASFTQVLSLSLSPSQRFKRTLTYFDTDRQYANFWGNPLCQATKRHLNNR